MSSTNIPAQPLNYLQTYSLKCEPFANTLDGRFFYASTALMQRLDLLVHLTQFGDSVVMVSGPKDSGKTTLLGRFTTQAAKQWRLCPINADEFEQFPGVMADALGVGDAQDELEMLSRWASETDNSQLLVILVDKAELLSESDLDLLCKLLESPVRERLRLILFGTPEAQQSLKNALDSRNLPGSRQLLEVPRLSEEETSAYLMYRLAVAGYSGESPFTATEIRGICKASEGRPGLINRLAHETLVENQARKRSKRVSAVTGKPRFGAAAWVPLTLAIVALATYVGWQRLQPAPEPEQPLEAPAVASRSVPLDIPTPAPVPKPKPEPEVPAALPSSAVPATADAQLPDLAAHEPVAQRTAEALPSPAPLATDTPDTGKQLEGETTETVVTEAQSVQPSAAPATVATPEAPSTRPAPKATAIADAKKSSLPEPMAPKADPTAAPQTTLPAAAIATGEIVAEPGKPEILATDKKSASTEVTEPAPESGTQGPHREAWLLAQQGKMYSLQLLGSRSQKSILGYISQYRLDPSRTAYYRGFYRGSDWYVLMYGIYPTRQAAVDARSGLPAAVRKGKPWPRDLASVHKAIREVRQ